MESRRTTASVNASFASSSADGADDADEAVSAVKALKDDVVVSEDDEDGQKQDGPKKRDTGKRMPLAHAGLLADSLHDTLTG